MIKETKSTDRKKKKNSTPSFMRCLQALHSEQLGNDMLIVNPFYLITLTTNALSTPVEALECFPKPADRDRNTLAVKEMTQPLLSQFRL